MIFTLVIIYVRTMIFAVDTFIFNVYSASYAYVQSELFNQDYSAVHGELPVVTSNGPPVNEISEDHVSIT